MSPHILILSLWHKGSLQFNIKYDFKCKKITFKTKRECGCDCLYKDVEQFINDNNHKIHYHFRKEILPINSALIENGEWKDKTKLLNEYIYNDTMNIVRDYLCYFRKYSTCGVEISTS